MLAAQRVDVYRVACGDKLQDLRSATQAKHVRIIVVSVTYIVCVHVQARAPHSPCGGVRCTGMRAQPAVCVVCAPPLLVAAGGCVGGCCGCGCLVLLRSCTERGMRAHAHEPPAAARDGRWAPRPAPCAPCTAVEAERLINQSIIPHPWPQVALSAPRVCCPRSPPVLAAVERGRQHGGGGHPRPRRRHHHPSSSVPPAAPATRRRRSCRRWGGAVPAAPAAVARGEEEQARR